MPVRTCRECFEEFAVSELSARNDDGFCSDPCMRQYDREIVGIHFDEGGEG